MSKLTPAAALLAALLTSEAARTQTCSCAAVPLLGSMQTSPTNEGEWYLGTTYEFHDVSELVAGSSTIPDTTGRDRTTSSMIIEGSRGLTEKWSLSALISGVEHEREVGGQFVSASGLGDGLVIAKYSLKRISLYSDSALAFGIGARVALGDDDVTREGVELAEDMHPSTGANGGIVMGYWARSMNDAGSVQIYNVRKLRLARGKRSELSASATN